MIRAGLRWFRGVAGVVLLGILVGLATRCAPIEPGLPRCPGDRPHVTRCAP